MRRPPSEPPCGVHELVAGSSAWRVRATKDKVKIGSFATPHSFSHTTRANIAHEEAEQIRARIVCTPAEKRRGGRGSDTYADGTIKINPISLCSHPDAHPNLNREVRHSLTWHSSKSESALERFEPVAVVQQLPDGRGTLFALVAARRQGEIYKRWNASYMTFGTFGHTKVR